MRALIVGLLLIGEIHLYSGEILHHHDEVSRVCQIEHPGGTYLHSAQVPIPLCPLCQIIRSSSVRPSVQPIIQKPYQESTYLPMNADRHDIPPTSHHRFLPAALLPLLETFASIRFTTTNSPGVKGEFHAFIHLQAPLAKATNSWQWLLQGVLPLWPGGNDRLQF